MAPVPCVPAPLGVYSDCRRLTAGCGGRCRPALSPNHVVAAGEYDCTIDAAIADSVANAARAAGDAVAVADGLTGSSGHAGRDRADAATAARAADACCRNTAAPDADAAGQEGRCGSAARHAAAADRIGAANAAAVAHRQAASTAIGAYRDGQIPIDR